MHRIQFDTNEGSHADGYWLHLACSLSDIAAIGDDMRNGLHVVIVMSGELEMEAILAYDEADQFWKAMPVPGTIVYLDGSE